MSVGVIVRVRMRAAADCAPLRIATPTDRHPRVASADSSDVHLFQPSSPAIRHA